MSTRSSPAGKSPSKFSTEPAVSMHGMATRSNTSRSPSAKQVLADEVIERLSRRIAAPKLAADVNPSSSSSESIPSAPKISSPPPAVVETPLQIPKTPTKKRTSRLPSVPDFTSPLKILPNPPKKASPKTKSPAKRQRTAKPADAPAPSAPQQPSVFLDVLRYLDQTDDSMSQPPPGVKPPSKSVKPTTKPDRKSELMTSSQREKFQMHGADLPMLYCDLDPSASRAGDSIDSGEYLVVSDSSSKSNAAPPAQVPEDGTAASLPKQPSHKAPQLSWDSVSSQSHGHESSQSVEPHTLTNLKN